MLSLDECRKILGPDAPDDERELAERREQAYRLARLLVEMYRSTQKRPSSCLESPECDIKRCR